MNEEWIKDEWRMMKDEGKIMNDEGWMKNYEGCRMNEKLWRMNDEGWWYQAVKGFFLLLKEQRWVNILYFSCIGHEDFDLYKRAALLSETTFEILQI